MGQLLERRLVGLDLAAAPDGAVVAAARAALLDRHPLLLVEQGRLPGAGPGVEAGVGAAG